MRRAVVVVALGTVTAACADNEPGTPLVEAHGGTRLMLEQLGYADGARQVDPSAFYDLVEHTECAPQRWDATRTLCTPIADRAVYRDSACTMAIGLGRAIESPTHFVAWEVGPEAATVRHVYRAGGAVAPPPQYYDLSAGDCQGPYTASEEDRYYAVTREVDPGSLVAFTDTTVGEGRLQISMHESSDGARIPFAVHDRVLDADCAPAPLGAGAFACAPVGAREAYQYADSACTQPVVIVEAGEPVPPAARLGEASGCGSYHSLGDEAPAPLYVRAGDRCVLAGGPPDVGAPAHEDGPAVRRALRVGPPLDLPPLTRAVEAAPGRRLQRIVYGNEQLSVLGDTLYDSALDATCLAATSESEPDTIRCLPTDPGFVSTFRRAGCSEPLAFVELAAQECEPTRFARDYLREVPLLREVGPLLPEPAYLDEGDQCVRYEPSGSDRLYSVGPPLRPDAFVEAIRFGER